MSAASARRTIARPREQIDHAHGKWLGVYNAKRIAEVAHQHHVERLNTEMARTATQLEKYYARLRELEGSDV